MTFCVSARADEKLDAARELYATGKYAACVEAAAKALEEREFDEDWQRSALGRISAVIKPGGALVIGVHEDLPEDVGGFGEWSARLRIYRKAD